MEPFNTFESFANQIRLTDAERLALRSELSIHMAGHPVTPIMSPYQRFLRAPAFVLAFVALLMIAAGGTAFAAEGTVPGDTLYGVKVSVVEPIEGSFATTPAEEATWQAHLANTRLEEAQTLAVAGKLDATNTVELSTKVAQASTRAALAIDTLATSSPSEAALAAVDLNTAITAHAAVLARLAASDTTSSSSPVLVAIIDAQNPPPVTIAVSVTAPAPSMRAAVMMEPMSVNVVVPTPQVVATTTASTTESADLRLFTRVHAIATASEVEIEASTSAATSSGNVHLNLDF